MLNLILYCENVIITIKQISTETLASGSEILQNNQPIHRNKTSFTAFEPFRM